MSKRRSKRKKTEAVDVPEEDGKAVDVPEEDGKAVDVPEEDEFRLLNAEEVTKMAIDFLKGLGHKRTTPTKVTQEGINHYVVEVDLKKKNATVVVDANAKEIKEFEIDTIKRMPKTGPSLSISPKIILLICGIQVLLTVLFNFLKGYLPIPFL